MVAAQDRFKVIPELYELHQKYGGEDTVVHRLEERVLELFTLYEINKALSLSMNLDDLFRVTMNLLGKSLHIDEYCLLLMDDESHELVIRASHGLSEDAIRRVRFGMGEGLSWQAFSIGEPIVVPDVSKEPGFLYYKGYKRDVGSFISVPLKLTSGRCIGVINAHRPAKDSFSSFDEKLFTAVAEHVAIALERAHIYEKTRELSIKDPLTNIYNRRYFFEYAEKEIERVHRTGRPLSIILADVDDFKHYNDTNGHMEGDSALKKIAGQLESHLRKGDVLARYGGEEFIALLPETGKESAIGVAEKLRDAIYSSCFKGGEEQPGGRVAVTLGVASYPGDGDDLVKLINTADRYLYLGKARGKNNVTWEETCKLPEK